MADTTFRLQAKRVADGAVLVKALIRHPNHNGLGRTADGEPIPPHHLTEVVVAATGEPDVASVASMELEHYPGMTEKAIEAMIDEAHRRFSLFGVRVVHRVGLLRPQDQIVLVAVTSAHRGESFQACEFLMDYLKTQAPFWKKEQTPEGAHWVDARVSDDAALARWGIQAANA